MARDGEPTVTPNSESVIRRILREVWGYDSFRPLQREAIAAVMGKRDSLLVLPTGGGKSICFQAPALARPGTAVVVSPLISLMRDQVAQLRHTGAQAGCLHSGQPSGERIEVLRALDAGHLKLLYLSPERLVSDNLASILGGASLSFLAIDEAHCISAWGHDFRPEYRQIARIRDQYPDVDIHGYTATATREVADDIVRQLSLRNATVYRGSFDRPNLYYAVKPKRGADHLLLDVVRRHPNQSGIVYCISRRETERVAGMLVQNGLNAAPYHAGMSPEDRIRIHEDFVSDRTHVIVATIAFGMGINKPDVRYIVHMGMPSSIENFQQESGRAGRDGLPAECVLLFSMQDLMVWKKIGSEAPEEIRRSASRKLDRIYEWCSGTTCRRRGLLNYFGEKYHPDNCRRCDVCTGGLHPVPDAHVLTQKILSCVVRLDGAATGVYTTDILLGKAGRKATEAAHDKLSTFGLLASHDRDHILDWIQQLTDSGHLAAGESGHLTVTDTGWEILRNRTTGILLDRLTLTVTPTATGDEPLSPMDQADFERLRELRKRIAEHEKVPPYVVFGDVTLRDMIRRRPRTLAEFAQVKGVGRKKLEAYGNLFLDILLDGRPRPKEDPLPPHQPRTKSRRINKKEIARDLIRQGIAITDVAEQAGLATSTIEKYHQEILIEEGVTDPSPWVPEDLEREIIGVLEINGDSRLRPIHDALEGRATYHQIRIVIACQRNRDKPHQNH